MKTDKSRYITTYVSPMPGIDEYGNATKAKYLITRNGQIGKVTKRDVNTKKILSVLPF